MRVLLIWLAFLAPMQAADDALQAAVQNMRRPSLEKPVRTLTDIGKPLVVFGGLLLVAAFDAAAGPATARLALVALAGTNLAVEGLKRTFGRARPDGEHKRSKASFPSSHAANAFALAFVLIRRYRRALWIFGPLATGVAFSRVYLNRHYMSDVIAGAAIGVLCAWAAARWFAHRAATKEAKEAPPG
jgi:membrane-associated phospholipid phosphatase